MSFITLIIIKNHAVKLYRKHYREIIALVKEQIRNKNNGTNYFLSDYFDDGYLIIDFNKKLIFNNQACFDSKKEVPGLKKFDLLEV